MCLEKQTSTIVLSIAYEFYLCKFSPISLYFPLSFIMSLLPTSMLTSNNLLQKKDNSK